MIRLPLFYHLQMSKKPSVSTSVSCGPLSFGPSTGLGHLDIVKQPLQHTDNALVSLQRPKISNRRGPNHTEQTVTERQPRSTRLVSMQLSWSDANSVPLTVCVPSRKLAARPCWNRTLLTVWTLNIEAEHIYNVMLQSPCSCLLSLLSLLCEVNLGPLSLTRCSDLRLVFFFLVIQTGGVVFTDCCFPGAETIRVL